MIADEDERCLLCFPLSAFILRSWRGSLRAEPASNSFSTSPESAVINPPCTPPSSSSLLRTSRPNKLSLWAAGAYLSMYLCNIFPHRTFPALLLGHLCLPISLWVIIKALESRNVPLVSGMMALSGFGNGLILMPVSLHAIAKHPDNLAVIVGAIHLFEPFGGTVAIAVMGSVLNNKLAGHCVSFSKGTGFDRLEFGDAGRQVVKDGVRWAFAAILPIVAAAAVAVEFLGDVDVDDTVHVEDMATGETRGSRWALWEYYLKCREVAARRRNGGNEVP